MNIKDILNTKVDIFKSSTNSGYVWYEQTLSYFLTNLSLKNKEKIMKLRDINKRDTISAKEYKKHELPGCTISATFDKYRVLHHIKERTGYIAIDIDHDKNPNLDIIKAKQDVMSFPFVALTMTSCRGEGIWCLIPYNKNNDFKDTFNALKEDFLELGYVIDDCKDETRLRIVSWDDNILIRQTDIEIYEKTIKHEPKPVYRNNSTEDEWKLTKDDLKDISIAIYLLTTYCNYTSDDYSDWLLDGFRLATIPNKELGLKLFMMISKNSDNFISKKDVEAKFIECCKSSKYSTNILGYYINKIKEYYGVDWRSYANDLLNKK